MNIVSISGSPSQRSRSSWLLQLAQTRLEGSAGSSTFISVRELPAAALLVADIKSEPIRRALAQVAEADFVIVATPIYKAAYSGVLKLFLDLLPPDALRGKTVLPLATGGGLAHLLALDYALKPVLSALGARHPRRRVRHRLSVGAARVGRLCARRRSGRAHRPGLAAGARLACR